MRNLLNKFNQTFGFTKTEIRVVLFLVLTFLIGIGIKAFKSGDATGRRFDYSASDSVFSARSKVVVPRDSIADDEVSDARENRQTVTKLSGFGQSLGSININTATKDEFMKLPGIGEAMAERIILYREENGPFSSVDGLTDVSGIGKRKLELIAPYCTVGK